MGLLSKIASSASIQTEKKVEEIFSFADWAKSKGFAHCALFSKVRGMMAITHAAGLDIATIEKSVSSVDFWKGTLSKSENDFGTKNVEVFSYSKADNEFYNFLQFFSFDIKNFVENILFVKISKNDLNTDSTIQSDEFSILMIFNTQKNQQIKIEKSDLQNIQTKNLYKSFNFETLENSINVAINSETENAINNSISASTNKKSYNLYSIDIQQTVLNALNTQNLPEANIKKAVLNCIYESCFDVIKNAFPLPNAVSFAEYTNIKFAILENSLTDEKVLEAHINLMLEKKLFNFKTHIDLQNCGKSNNANEIISFLN